MLKTIQVESLIKIQEGTVRKEKNKPSESVSKQTVWVPFFLLSADGTSIHVSH